MQRRRRPNLLDDGADGARIVEVATRGGIRQEQMVLHHGHEGLHIGCGETHAETDRGHEIHADLGVISRVALADVVQEGAHQQEVGPFHPSGESGRFRRGLQQVPVDGEPVVDVALRPASARLPFRQEPHEQPHLVERLDRRDG